MCEWRSKSDSSYRCKVPPEPGSRYCIFHKPSEKDIERFKEAFYKQINKEGTEANRNPQYNFRGYVFPTSVTVGSDRNTEAVALPNSIPALDFAEAQIKGNVSFAGAKIEGDVLFSSAKIMNNASFRRTRIGGRAFFSNVEIEGDVSFGGIEIEGGVVLWRAKVRGRVSFHGAKIEDRFLFSRAKIGEDGVFTEAEIIGDAFFESTTIGGILLLSNSKIKGKVDFSSCQAAGVSLGRGRPTIRWTPRVLRCLPERGGISLEDQATAHSFWSFAREAFQKQGERERADAAHYFERLSRMSPWQVRRGEPRWLLRRLWIIASRWIWDCLFLRWPAAYGASMGRLFATWGFLTGCFAALYYLLPLRGVELFAANSPGLEWPFSFGRALYFSIVTFTTLGYGDIRPTPGLGSALTSAETALGGIVMALTVLVIGRKFMR